jgi:hypothetical protein
MVDRASTAAMVDGRRDVVNIFVCELCFLCGVHATFVTRMFGGWVVLGCTLSIVEDDVWLREERSHGREASLSPACTSAHIYSTIQFQRMCLSKSIPIPKVVDPDVGNTLRTQS